MGALSTYLPRRGEVMGMTSHHRPKRRPVHDRVLSAAVSAEETACQMALAPFDRAWHEAERRWGIEKLPELVSPETAAKWGAALGALNDAIATSDRAAVTANVSNCVRAVAALEAEAAARGHAPIPPTVWQVEHEGTVYGIVQDIRDWPAAEQALPGAVIVGLREIAVALHAHRNAMAAVPQIRAAFPQAEVTAVRPTPFDDEIPFAPEVRA